LVLWVLVDDSVMKELQQHEEWRLRREKLTRVSRASHKDGVVGGARSLRQDRSSRNVDVLVLARTQAFLGVLLLVAPLDRVLRGGLAVLLLVCRRGVGLLLCSLGVIRGGRLRLLLLRVLARLRAILAFLRCRFLLPLLSRTLAVLHLYTGVLT
jgi:hypothetical protein